MDNFEIKLVAEDPETLKEALRICFRHNAPGGRITHWIEKDAQTDPEWIGASDKRKMLVLLWAKEEGSHKLPVPLKADGAFELVSRWLEEADYGPEPDHDGDNDKGFCLYCDHWGHVDDLHYAVVGIIPAWAMYGK